MAPGGSFASDGLLLRCASSKYVIRVEQGYPSVVPSSGLRTAEQGAPVFTHGTVLPSSGCCAEIPARLQSAQVHLIDQQVAPRLDLGLLDVG